MVIQSSATQLILRLIVYTENSSSIVTSSVHKWFQGRAARSANNSVQNRPQCLLSDGQILWGKLHPCLSAQAVLFNEPLGISQ
jgi:hypothetical protein